MCGTFYLAAHARSLVECVDEANRTIMVGRELRGLRPLVRKYRPRSRIHISAYVRFLGVSIIRSFILSSRNIAAVRLAYGDTCLGRVKLLHRAH